jgi:hypothetical protein
MWVQSSAINIVAVVTAMTSFGTPFIWSCTVTLVPYVSIIDS